jgi:hypothetical protein
VAAVLAVALVVTLVASCREQRATVPKVAGMAAHGRDHRLASPSEELRRVMRQLAISV